MAENRAERLENLSPLGYDLDGNLLVRQEDWFWLSEIAEKHIEAGEGFWGRATARLGTENNKLRKALEQILNIDDTPEFKDKLITAGVANEMLIKIEGIAKEVLNK